jgi:phytoene dehydrogenase-like protein
MSSFTGPAPAIETPDAPGGADGPRRSDALVIGAGHNGLTTAAYLAKAGLDVQVLEAYHEIGGMLTANAIFPDAPEHVFSEGGIQASLFYGTTINEDLQLERHGLRRLYADPFHVHLEPEGPSLAFWQDAEKTAQEIGRFSRKDAEAYRRFARMLDAGVSLVFPYLTGHPLRPRPKTVLEAIPTAIRHRKEIAPLVRFFTGAHEDLILEYFEHPLVRAAMASMPPFCWMRQDGTGWALIYLGICHRTGSWRFEGASGALPRALASSLRSNGGRIRTSAVVESLIVERGTVVGARLAGGDEYRADVVVAACSPVATFNQLLPEGVLDDQLQRRVAGIPTQNTGAGNLKIDMALKGRVVPTRHNAWREDGLDLREPIVSWHTYEDHIQAWDDAVAGRWPERIPFISIVPTAIDPTQGPAGQDTLWLWSGIIPSRPQVPWQDVRDEVQRKVLADLSSVYDGIEELLIDVRTMGPPDLEERFFVPGGNVYHVDPFMMRFGPFRPAPGFSSYDTPIPGLYITGAGTHPTGGIAGIPGQQAALRLLRKRGVIGARATARKAFAATR